MLDTFQNGRHDANMRTDLTPAQLLADELLGRPLSEYVAEKRRSRRPKWSWRLIAEQLAEDTDGKVDVTGETLRIWYGAEVAA